LRFFRGDACPLHHSKGDIFYQNSKFIRGNGSSESTRFPEGLVLGNWAKTLHPRNVGYAKFVNKFVGHLRREVFCFARRQHSWKNPDESHTSC
jgi:hypothetical protein